MSDELRTFECTLDQGKERALIKDVLVVDGAIYLVVEGLTYHKSFVFEILPRGIRIALKKTTEKVLAFHSEELLRFQSQVEAARAVQNSLKSGLEDARRASGG